MFDMPPLTESVDSVPCPNPACVNGLVATGRVLAGNRHEPPESEVRTCHYCEGEGVVPPVMLDPEFQPECWGPY